MLRCGTEDHLLAQNRRFAAACKANGVDLDSAFTPGDHNWPYWDAQLPAVLDWMLGKREI